MPQSLNLVVIHLIFTAEERCLGFEPGARPQLHAYLATLARNAGCECYRVGGVADHVHLVLRLSPTVTIADLIENLRTSSSNWLQTQFAGLASFSWQGGYDCFSVGPTDLDALCVYIDKQEKRHRARAFRTNGGCSSKNTGSSTTRRTCGIKLVRRRR